MIGFKTQPGPPPPNANLAEQARHFATYEAFREYVRERWPAAYEAFAPHLMEIFLEAHGVSL